MFNLNKNKKKKTRLGIDINEVLRNRWMQYDRYYVQEFGEEGVPQDKNPYVYDFFKEYKWQDTTEVNKVITEHTLDELEKMNLKPEFYQVDEVTGKAPVDDFAFRKEEINLTAKEMYDRFMYEDFNFEIFGNSTQMYRNMDVDFDMFYQAIKDNFDVIILSKECRASIPPTLYFLSNMMSRVKKYVFAETNEEVWDNVDVLITSDPELLTNVPLNKYVIKVDRPYNHDIPSQFTIIHLIELLKKNETGLILDKKLLELL